MEEHSLWKNTVRGRTQPMEAHSNTESLKEMSSATTPFSVCGWVTPY